MATKIIKETRITISYTLDAPFSVDDRTDQAIVGIAKKFKAKLKGSNSGREQRDLWFIIDENKSNKFIKEIDELLENK